MLNKDKRLREKETRERAKVFHKNINELFKKNYRYSLRYEDDLIMDDGKAYVNVDLTKIDTPFSVFSYDKRIDPGIYDYIDNAVYYLKAEVPVVINFDDGGNYSKELKESIKKAVTRHYHLKYEDTRYEHRKYIRFAALIGLFGILLLTAHFLIMSLVKAELTVIHELTLILSWMFIWQSADMFLISGHSKRIDIFNDGQLALAEITFGKRKTK